MSGYIALKADTKATLAQSVHSLGQRFKSRSMLSLATHTRQGKGKGHDRSTDDTSPACHTSLATTSDVQEVLQDVTQTIATTERPESLSLANTLPSTSFSTQSSTSMYHPILPPLLLGASLEVDLVNPRQDYDGMFKTLHSSDGSG